MVCHLKKTLHKIVRWFDNQSRLETIQSGNFKKIDWLRCLPFLFLHISCFGVVWVGWSWTAVWFAVILYLVRMFAITGFYHRYFSHRSFKTSRKIQFLFAVLGNMAAQRGPLWWAAHHRHHHKNSDKEGDVHSPQQDGFWWAHMFWFTNENNFHLRSKLIPDLMRYPELRFIDRFDILIPILLALSLFALGSILESISPEFGTNGPQMLIWGFFISTVILFHSTCSTNSLAHIFGYRSYPTHDNSKNNLLVSILTLGEGWHNNHHYFPNAVRQGVNWWEFDVTYLLLLIMFKLGMIWDLRICPQYRNVKKEIH